MAFLQQEETIHLNRGLPLTGSLCRRMAFAGVCPLIGVFRSSKEAH